MHVKEKIKTIVRQLFPIAQRRRLVRYTRWPPVGRVDFENLRRLTPISRCWGGDRGLPIDRYYIEKFLTAHAEDVQGYVLEVGDNQYTQRFGGHRVTKSDIVDVSEGNTKATLVADLSCGSSLPSAEFDCIICTQTLQYVFPVKSAIRTLHRLLNPGGVLLGTFPGISKIDRSGMEEWGEYWRFTTLSVKRLFEEFFMTQNFHISTYGNVFTAIAFLHGLAADELDESELAYLDSDYPLIISVRAVKF